MDFRKNLGTILDHVDYRNEKVIVTRGKKSKAAIVPMGEYRMMQQLKKEARARFFTRVDDMQERVKDVDSQTLKQLVEEAVTAIRKEKTPEQI